MKSSLERDFLVADQDEENTALIQAKNEFRDQFQRALLQCVKHGFLPEECFGQIWEEIMVEVCLPEAVHRTMFDELIAWTRNRLR